MKKEKKPLDHAFISRMRQLAENAGSVNALAKQAGISQSGIRRYFEGGEPARPLIVALAKAGNVSVNWLISGEEDQPKKTTTIHQHFPNPSMKEMALWINEQDDGINYWEIAKAKLALEFPEFREWLKKHRENSSPSADKKITVNDK